MNKIITSAGFIIINRFLFDFLRIPTEISVKLQSSRCAPWDIVNLKDKLVCFLNESIDIFKSKHWPTLISNIY